MAGEITNEFTCSHCLEVPPAFGSARTAVVADAFMLDIIHRYKYGGALYFEPFLANLLNQQAVPALKSAEKWNFIVPVPLHPVKKREREFNQAERLARCLGKAVDLPVNTRIIQRIEPTRSQTTLDRQQRAKNVQNAFAPWKKQLQGEKIVLIDDVMTTGATTNACAKALLKAGAGKVCVWAVARGV